MLARETAAALAEHDPPALAARIGQRVSFAAAARSGRLVHECNDTPAARKIAALARAVDALGAGRAAP